MQEANRVKARACGEKRYESGSCHVCSTTVKYTSSGACVVCSCARRKAGNKKGRKPSAVFREAIAIDARYSKEGNAEYAKPYVPPKIKDWPVGVNHKPDDLTGSV